MTRSVDVDFHSLFQDVPACNSPEENVPRETFTQEVQWKPSLLRPEEMRTLADVVSRPAYRSIKGNELGQVIEEFLLGLDKREMTAKEKWLIREIVITDDPVRQRGCLGTLFTHFLHTLNNEDKKIHTFLRPGYERIYAGFWEESGYVGIASLCMIKPLPLY